MRPDPTLVTGDAACGQATGSDAVATRRARMATQDVTIESEICAYLQRRLAMVVAFLGIAGAALFVVSRVTDLARYGFRPADALHPSVLVHLAAILATIPVWRYLRGDARPARRLHAIDALVAGLVLGVCLLIYAFSYRTGIIQLVPLLGLLLIARSVAIPSHWRRTLLLSLPAPVGVLAIQMAHGEAFVMDGVPWPQSGFPAFVVWEQAILILAVVLATLTSRVLYGLRLKVFQAAKMGRYSLEERIGGGAVGEVYRAHHALIRRPVAIKVLRPEIAGEQSLERFEKEVQRTCGLTHPNTVSIFDYGLTSEGLFFYAMELLDGADLDRVVEVGGPLPASRVLHVLLQTCGALQEAHDRGLVHCDLKPANLMLCRQGGRSDVVKVLDFGLARNVALDEEGRAQDGMFGTPQTMAPEVIRGGDLGPTTDLYSLGAVGYFLSTGESPFRGGTVGEVLAQHLSVEPAPPSERRADVPADLERCLLHCLKKDPGQRPASAAVLLAEMQACTDAGGWSPEDAEGWWGAHAAALGAKA